MTGYKLTNNKNSVFTAIFNDYETLYDPCHPEDGVDYICFTDNKNLISNIWRIIYLENIDIPAPLFYKRIKCLPHVYLPEYNYTLWVDANFQIKIKNYFKYMKTYMKSDSILLYQHFCLGGMHRNCIYKEARFSIGLPKYASEDIQNQLSNYHNEGYPQNNGLFQSGFLLRNNKDKDVIKFNKLWYEEICKYGKNVPQCQLSLPFCLWKTKVKYSVVDDDIIWNNEIYNINNHKHSKIIHDNCIIEELKNNTYKERKHFIIFGNDHTINDFDFSKLKGTDLITAGVNRIWKKHECDYLYAMDGTIIKELKVSKPNIKTLIVPEYMFKNKVEEYPNLVKDFNNIECNKLVYKDYQYPHQSVTWLIQTLKDIYKEFECIFYIYGVSLKWDENHHFWVNDTSVINNKDKAYHLPIFNLYFNGFKQLKNTKTKFISVSKDSKLNEIVPYTDINSLLERRTL